MSHCWLDLLTPFLHSFGMTQPDVVHVNKMVSWRSAIKSPNRGTAIKQKKQQLDHQLSLQNVALCQLNKLFKPFVELIYLGKYYLELNNLSDYHILKTNNN